MSDADLKSPRRWTRRPLFSPSQMLTAQQLNALIDGQRAQSGMLMRALHGHGVIFGFAVTLHDRKPAFTDRKAPAEATRGGSTKLAISCGMALDRHGRLLRWPEGVLRYCEVANAGECAGVFTLSVHYAERRLPKGGCGPCGDNPEWIEEGVVFTLTEGCEPADRACPAPKPGACVSWEEYVCARNGSEIGKLPPAPDLAWACDASGELCRIDCSDTHYDARAGIPIACVEVVNLAAEGCPAVWGFGKAGGGCEIRPRVYRTPLLYELVRGCQDNLARVESLSWQDWLVDAARQDWEHNVPWEELEQLLLAPAPKGLTINFTRPIRARTVHPGSVFLTAVYWEPGADYLLTRRIPARPLPVPKDADLATGFRLVLDKDWIASEITSRSTLRDGGRIELTIRGQMLRDECGNMLNAVPLFYQPKTPVQASPGGDFVAVFSFDKPKAPPARQKAAAPAPQSARSTYKF